MPRRPLLAAVLMALAPGVGCDMESLRSGALFPARDAGTDAHDGASANDGAADSERDLAVEVEAGIDADTNVDRSDDLRADVDIDIDATADVPADGPDGATDTQLDAVVDAPVDIAGPTGMLSGTVRDSCGHAGIDALVGIGGRHTCSFREKGSYFFARLPVGTLKLAATKDGYALYEATVEIVAGGNIRDIQLTPADTAGGCATLPAPPVACTCTASTCDP